MFFNRYIGKITGAKYVWKNHPVFSFVNVIFWLILLAVVIFISLKYKKNKERILIFIQSSLLILGMVSFIFTLVKAPKEAFSRRQLYLDGSEQFTVGAETNVILLIADAVDNSFVKEVMNDNPEVFDVYNDFTLYTDTCSVYDLTNTSIPQMLYGYTQIEESNKSVEFLSRFDESGFRMLFYGVNAIMPGSECYISNYASSGNLEDVSSISYDLINRYFILLSVYEIVPCYFKSMIPVNIIDFDQCIVFKKNKQDVIHDNSVFEKNLRLTFNENSPKCFIYQHLDGAHLPCDDYVGETKHCLNIFGEYIKQLKELDIYDNSVIIIASDHGVHDDVNGLPYGVAATPMFMVKGKGEHYDHIVISEKPIYYRYFMATIVRYAGLTDSTGDYEIFGKSIEDYSEREVMTRVWFDGSFSSNRYRKYKYTGDTKELERVVNEGVYEEVDTLQYDYSDLD
ncbi:MAG: hypothetical protein IKN45_07375 [Lachnospiraceae bacterium]|nr:hypothetical protein [Lachnospiraceae bacterium]